MQAVKTVSGTNGYASRGFSQLRRVLTGRSGVVVLGALLGVVVVEVAIAGALISQAHVERQVAGYSVGSHVGASVASSSTFKMPDIDEDVLAASTDGKMVFAVGVHPNQLLAFDTETLKTLGTVRLSGEPTSVSVAGDGQVIVLVDHDALDVFNVASDGSLTLSGSTKLALDEGAFVSEIAVAPDGSRVYGITSPDDEQVVAFDSKDGHRLAFGTVDGTRAVGVATASATGMVFAASETSLAALDPSDLHLVASYPTGDGGNGNYYQLVASPLGDRVISSWSGELVSFDGEYFAQGASYSQKLPDVFSPMGTVIVVSLGDKIQVSDAASGLSLFSIPARRSWATVVVLPDPDSGFLIAPYKEDGRSFKGHLERYETQAPRVTAQGLGRTLGLVDLFLVLSFVLVAFLWPRISDWRASAPARAAANDEQMRVMRARAETQRSQADAAREARAHEARVAQLAQWQAAYVELNPGKDISAMPLPVFIANGDSGTSRDRTNPLAVAAFIFGVLGGFLAVPFGLVARSQIRRTGERGKGLATAGVVLGFIWIAMFIALVLVAWVAAANT